VVELRWNDYSLSEEQIDLRAMLHDFFTESSPAEVVRAAEPVGADAGLWQATVDAGLAALAVPEEAGGQGAGLVELLLAAEEVGRTLAPVPLVDHNVATRLLAAAAPDSGDLAPAVAGDLVLSLAPLSSRRSGPQLVPSGAVARGVLLVTGGELLLLRRPEPPAHAVNQGSLPLAWWDPADPAVSRTVLASGPDAARLWGRASDEWQVATAAALVGLADGANRIARLYTTQRTAFGVPIATFQAISHALVNAHMAVQTARNLALKAAWFSAEEPAARPELPTMALAHAARTATEVTAACVHVHGGFGITHEADVSLYHQRAAAWGQVGGGSRVHLDVLGAAVDRLAARRAAASPPPVPDAPAARPAADLVTSGGTR
jgi:hypothetical protein